MKLSLFILALSCLTLAAGDLDPRLAPLAETYQKQLKTLTDQGIAKKSAAVELYLAELKDAEAKYTKASRPGEVKILAAITKEITDIGNVVAVPNPPVDLPKLLQARHKTFYKTFEEADAKTLKQKAALDSHYLTALGNLLPSTADAALSAQIEAQRKGVISGNFGPITDVQAQLPGSRWQSVNNPTEFSEFHKDGSYKYWKYTTPDAQTVILHWNPNASITWKLGKDGRTLFLDGKPDLRLAPPAADKK
jgi:hypothetical protein